MSPGSTTSGVGAVSSLSWSHAATATMPNRATARVARTAKRVGCIGFVIYGAPLEAQRETRGEVADLRRGEEIGRAVIRLRGRVDLGIEAAVVGPGVQVAAGEGEYGRPRAGTHRIPLRQRE